MITTMTDAQMEDVLRSQVFGYLACSEQNFPYIVPMAYLYRDNVLYGQTTEGLKTDILRRNGHVCFHVGRGDPESGWDSVIVRGRFEELDFSSLIPESADIVRQLSERLGPAQKTIGVNIPISFDHPAHPLSANGKQATFFRVVLDEKTGRTSRGA